MAFGSERHIGDILKERNIEIVGGDPITRHGFTQVPNFVLTKKEISVGAKLAYAMLLKYAWDNDACFPGQLKLAEDMGAAERSVRTYLKELESFGMLEIKQRGLGKTNLYRLHLTIDKFCRSRTAMIAASERQILPVTLYKNTHLRILIRKRPSRKMHFQIRKRMGE
jgi:hypothetical protein